MNAIVSLCHNTYLHVFSDLEKSKGHSTTNDHLIDLVQHVFYQLDLVCYFGTGTEPELCLW